VKRVYPHRDHARPFAASLVLLTLAVLVGTVLIGPAVLLSAGSAGTPGLLTLVVLAGAVLYARRCARHAPRSKRLVWVE